MEIQYVYLIVIGVMSLVSFALFMVDNFIAVGSLSGARIPEYVLFVSMALGGGIGGLLGMVIFSHKTRKLSFKILSIFSCVVIVATAIALFFI